MVVENSPESHKPVEIGDLGAQGDSKIWGSLRGPKRPTEAVRGDPGGGKGGVRVAMERKPGVFASSRGQLELLNCISRISEGSPRCTSSGRLK